MSKSAFALPKYYKTNISFDREPQNAMEYLLSVRHEAEAMPSYTTVKIDNDKINTLNTKEDTEEIKEDNTIENNDNINKCTYTDEWATEVIDDFENLRNMVIQRRQETQIQTDKFPHCNDESGWKYYCFPKQTEDNINILDPIQYNCRKPDLSELIHMDYLTTNAIFNYHYEWLIVDEMNISKDICIWLYALLVLVDLPLNPRKIESDIRGIYSYFLKYKNERLNSVDRVIKDTIQSYIDIILVITGTYFHQNY